MFSRFSLKVKLLAAFGVVTALFLLVGANGIWALYRVDNLYSHVAEDNVPMLLALGEVESGTTVLEVMAYKLSTGPNGVSPHLSQIAQKIKDSTDRVKENLTKMGTMCDLPEEKILCKETRESSEALMDLTAKVLEYTKAGRPDDLNKRTEILDKEYEAATVRFQIAIDKHGEAVGNEEQVYNTKAGDAADLAYKTVPAGLAIGILIALGLGLIIARALSKTLSDIATRLTSGADQVTNASGEISQSSSQLSSSATQQAAALAETVSALEEIGAMVGRNAENSQRSVEISKESQTGALAGTEAVNQMLQSMDEINRSNNDIESRIAESNREISGIIAVINEIGTKTKVINDIVFQTKLLSFNASVEAARAGEHGKGFAVVAEEVGNLAAMSGNAAKEIAELLDGSIQKVEQIVNNTKQQVEKLMESGRTKVEAGSSTAKRCEETLNELAQKASRAYEMANEIATASQEQAQGVREINKAMTQLDQVTQQNAQASQKASYVSERLRSQTQELEQIVSLLNQTIFGGSTAVKHTQAKVEPTPQKAKPAIEKKKEAKVIPMPASKKAAPAPVEEAPKKAAGSDLTLPSEADPRFKDF